MDRFWRVVDAVTVEPALLLFSLCRGLQSPTDMALWYSKTCMNLYQDTWTCDNLANDSLKDQEHEVQTVNSQWDFYNSICMTLPAMVLTFLYGSWSDKVSRTIPMLLPVAGIILSSIIFSLNALFMQSSLFFMLIGSLIIGVTGGTTTMLMATMSYVSDVAHGDSRTFRISILYASSSLGYFIAYTVSGVLFEATGFITVYGITVIISIIAGFYIIFGFKDIKRPGHEKHTITDRFCNLDHVKEAFMVTFRKRSHKNRLYIWIIIIMIFLFMLSSTYSIDYLYLKHPPLSLSQTLYGYYEGYRTLLSCTCLFFAVPLLKKTAHLSDGLLLIMAIISQIIYYLIFAFSVQAWMVFTAPLLGYLRAALFTFIRGLISSVVSVDELGKIFAVVAIVENIGSVAASGWYNYFLYPYTLDVFAGLSYIFAAVLTSTTLIPSIWIYISLKKQKYAMMQEELIQYTVDPEESGIFETLDERY